MSSFELIDMGPFEVKVIILRGYLLVVVLLKWDRIKSIEFRFMICPLPSSLYILELLVIKYIDRLIILAKPY